MLRFSRVSTGFLRAVLTCNFFKLFQATMSFSHKNQTSVLIQILNIPKFTYKPCSLKFYHQNYALPCLKLILFLGGVWLCTITLINWNGARGDLRRADDEVSGARLPHGRFGLWQYDCGPRLLLARRTI